MRREVRSMESRGEQELRMESTGFGHPEGGLATSHPSAPVALCFLTFWIHSVTLSLPSPFLFSFLYFYLTLFLLEATGISPLILTY